MSAAAGRWWSLLRRASDQPARVRLLVAPHAGAGPGTLRSLASDLPLDVEVLGLSLPGRERRFSEPPGASLTDVRDSLDEVAARAPLPTVVFGHSFGALLAVHIASALGAQCHGVVVSGQVAGARKRWTDSIRTDEELLSVLGMAGATTLEVLDDADVRRSLLTALGADLRLGAQAAADLAGVIVDAPIYVVTADADAVMPDGNPGHWRTHTRNECEVVTIHGGHFALLGEAGSAAVRDVLRRATDRVARDRRAALACLPFGGSGASFFRQWQALAAPGLAIRGLRLPGREDRLREEPVTSISAAVDAVLTQALNLVDEYERVGLFGHSIGAILAFELARELERKRPGRVCRLFVSGSPGPHHRRHERITGLDDDTFVEQVRQLAGHRDVVLDDPEMRAVLLPTLRADVEMHEAYVAAVDATVTIPVTVLRGGDDSLVSRDDSAGWADVTTGTVTHVECAGGHMYLVDRPVDVVRVVQASLGLVAHDV